MTEKKQPRTYRSLFSQKGLVSFEVRVLETDLFIQACSNLQDEAKSMILECRKPLEDYILAHPEFARSFAPVPVSPLAHPLIRSMAQAGTAAQVGPMAAVAGAIAQFVGRGLAKSSEQVIVENGGDLFVLVPGTVTAAVYAGNSPFSNKIGVRVDTCGKPMGICTSSATVGHSKSLGRADAAVVIASDCALADAAATALGNLVTEKNQMNRAVNWALGLPGVLGALVIFAGRMAAGGQLEIVGV
jgi:ApbE superfamily uncharacterized protein (UPF0280 family)